ncbi:MAG: JAB domain-containing protein [bacterium]
MSPSHNFTPSQGGGYNTNKAELDHQHPLGYSEDLILLLARVILDQRTLLGRKMCAPDDVEEFFVHHFAAYEREVFGCLFLDTRLRVITHEDLFFGTFDGAVIHPREVVRRVLNHNASAVICAHNHSSADPTPSNADRKMTEHLKKLLSLVEVRLIDHIVVGGAGSVSLAKLGEV